MSSRHNENEPYPYQHSNRCMSSDSYTHHSHSSSEYSARSNRPLERNRSPHRASAQQTTHPNTRSSSYRGSSSRRSTTARPSSRHATTNRLSTTARPSSRRGSTSRPSVSASQNFNIAFIVKIAIIIIVVLGVIFFISTCVNNTTSSSQDTEVSTDQTGNDPSASSASGSSTPTEELVPNKAALLDILDEENASKLLALAETNDDALWIAAHPEAYAPDDPEKQHKILKLAANEEAALAYVRELAELYPQDEATTDTSLAMSTKSPSSSVPDTSIPHLYQWDRRWGQTVYCSTSFGLTGCGPTSLAMVYQGLTGDTSKTPYDMALLAQEYGYMFEFNGTADGFFMQVANDLGLDYEIPDHTAENITSALSEGKVIIANFWPGYFTDYGHFVVLAGLDDDGKVIMNDPYSVVRSSQTWDPNLIADETHRMYVYSVS